MWCALYVYGTSQFRVATFQGLGATILGDAAVK